MTKTRQAEIKLFSNGYSIEYVISPKGKKLAVAVKDEKRTYGTTVLQLVKKLNLINH
jgi:hypothetical protein